MAEALPEFENALGDGSVQANITVGTTQVEAKVGASALANREHIRIFNKSNATIYAGPTGVTTTTGEPIFKNQWWEGDVGPNNAIFLIAAGAGNTVMVWEFA